MPLPTPEPGLVINYEFLWSQESAAGETEGEKRRPAVIVSVTRIGKEIRTIVAPMTHSQPRPEDAAIEIPPRVKAHLGLDDKPSWVILKELNEFAWPGFDLYQVPNSTPGTFHYGLLPPSLFAKIRDGILTLDAKLKSQISR